jgi:sortase (surface protein transpeptidase)
MPFASKLQRFRRPARRFVRGKTGQRTLIALGVLLLVYAGWDGFTRYQATHLPPSPSTAPQVVTQSTDKPAETKPNPKTYTWFGAPTMPKYLRLPAIKAEGFVQQVGVDQHKAIAVPTNIHLAGWFNQSQLPGAKGLSIIDGHLDGRTGGGIFEHLAKLKPGHQFTITYGDNSTKTFTVRTVQSLPTAETAAVLFSQDPKITHQLNLITCGGNFNESNKQYDERVVVTAELVGKL